MLEYLLATQAGDFTAEIEAAADARRRLRRKLSFAEIEALQSALAQLHCAITARISKLESIKVDGSDIENGRLLHNSKTEVLESELTSEMRKATVEPSSRKPGLSVSSPSPISFQPSKQSGTPSLLDDEPRLPLALVKRACPEISNYAQGEIMTWRDLIAAAAFVRGMMGISPSAWEEAQRFMGSATAAIVVAAMLERAEAINSHGGYLRALSSKAAEGAFSPGPMVMALLNRPEGRAA